MVATKKKKAEDARKRKLYVIASFVLLAFGWQQASHYIESKKVSALRAQVFGNEITDAEISQLVNIREMPLFAAMSKTDSNRAEAINAAIFSSRTIIEPQPEPEPEPEEVKATQKSEPPQRPDYLRHFNEQFIVTGTLFGGAIINNEFTATGESLNRMLRTPIGDREVKLMRATQDQLTIMVDGTLYSIPVR